MKVFLLLMFWCVFANGYPMIPDEEETWGTTCDEDEPDFEEYRYSEQIPYCQRNVSSALKRKIYEEYEIEESERKDYTIDHLIPLSIGGDNLEENLWPEHKAVKALRPDLEMKAYVALRDGKMKQAEAIAWVLEEKFNPEKQNQQIIQEFKSMMIDSYLLPH